LLKFAPTLLFGTFSNIVGGTSWARMYKSEQHYDRPPTPPNFPWAPTRA